jgi:malate synthase
MTDATLAAPTLVVRGPIKDGFAAILTPEALAFVGELEAKFGQRRRELLAARVERQKALDAGENPDFPKETAELRAAPWKVRPAPADLQDRRVEITGPVDRKMVINALNSGAKCFMADFEDASTPSWTNMVEGQINVRDAVARTLTFEDPTSGKKYALKDQLATLIVRPRGWHLEEAHVTCKDKPISGSLFDFGLYLFHNHKALKAINSGPYYYLPKMESAKEAQLWADVFAYAEDRLKLERGTCRATILIETIMAPFQLDEILHAMKDWIVGLNCGRWDYIFSYIKRFRARPDKMLPDRGRVTMTVPFMRAYSRLVIERCHTRGAHAMGGMSAFIPVKGDEAANAKAYEQLRMDKTREAGDGHDGTWVAHPGMIAEAMAVFDKLMPAPNQLGKLNGFTATAAELIEPARGDITIAGARGNASVGIQYIASWLQGRGAAPINNLMEDAATAEISRAQLWQWRTHGAKTDDGQRLDDKLVAKIVDEESKALAKAMGDAAFHDGRFDEATEILRGLALDAQFEEFLTLPAYQRILELK